MSTLKYPKKSQIFLQASIGLLGFLDEFWVDIHLIKVPKLNFFLNLGTDNQILDFSSVGTLGT